MTANRGRGKPAEAEPLDELLEVVDEQGQVLELRTRGEIHTDRTLTHRAVHVLVRNSAGELFLQKRSKNKFTQPGKWDASVGGHVDPGESYETAALREMEEELGLGPSLLGKVRPQRMHDYIWRCPQETEHVRTFGMVWEGPFSHNPVEIDDGRFWSAQQLRDAAGSGVLTANLEHELRLLGIIS